MLDLQLYAIFVLMLAGACVGLIYDLVRAVRERVRRSSWLGEAADLFFWFLALVALGAALLIANWGDLRGYVPLSAALGLIAYRVMASPVVLRCARVVVGAGLGAGRLVARPTLALGRRWRRRHPPTPK